MPFSLLVALILIFVVVAAEPQLMLFLLTFGYVLSGPVMMLIDHQRKRVVQVIDDDGKTHEKIKNK
jgi:CDP-diacylglycerol--serine O-phosphatidyltransferase